MPTLRSLFVFVLGYQYPSYDCDEVIDYGPVDMADKLKCKVNHVIGSSVKAILLKSIYRFSIFTLAEAIMVVRTLRFHLRFFHWRRYV